MNACTLFAADDVDMPYSDCALSPTLFMYTRMHVLARRGWADVYR